MKKRKLSKQFLDELRKIPIVQVACEKTGLSRNSVYRWRKDDPDFATAMDEAMQEGEAFLNDMTENQLLTLIKKGEFSAIALWLRSRHPKFKTKVEVSGSVNHTVEPLNEEQQKLIREALTLALPQEEEHEEDE